MNASKSGASKRHKVHVFVNDSPICGSSVQSGWQTTMFLEPNCKKCIAKQNKTQTPVARTDINAWVHEHISCEGGVLALDGFDEAFVGVVDRIGMDTPAACYDFEKCIEILMKRDGMNYEDAQEYFWFNVAGSWVGEQTPFFLRKINK